MFKCSAIDFSNKVSLVNYTFLLSISVLLIDGLTTGMALANERGKFKQETYSARIWLAQNLDSNVTINYDLLAEEILAEINRVRSDPQAYAEWLESRKQYFEGTVLKLPGEKPIRTNRGKEALEEAVILLKNQESLPSISSGMELVNIAKEQINNITSEPTNLNLREKTISYGKYTAEGIVMQLIVDDGNRDRLNRQKILNPNTRSTGITCQAHERYDNICAIAYEGDSLETTAENIDEASEFTRSVLPEANSEPNEIVITTKEETINSNENSALSSLPTSNVSRNPSLLLEKIHQGKLEEGDTTIPDDGSFYDSYPLQGNAGDSFIISVESQEFDTFLAVMDTEGNILGQNDDISEGNSNSRLEITLPSNGVYSVIVNAYDEGGRGNYLLTVRR
ncbi:MAG: pre-peptidase C-terminal domain-containing protein [Xenococcaceae cyanobacterium]